MSTTPSRDYELSCQKYLENLKFLPMPKEKDSSQPKSKSIQSQIQTACTNLEFALKKFEDNSGADLRMREDSQKIKKIKKTLVEIKEQIDQLST